MASSGMLRRVTLVRAEVSEEISASFIRVTRIYDLGTKLAVTSNRRTLRRNTKKYQYQLVFLRSVRRLLVASSYFNDSCQPDEGGAKFLQTSVHTRATRRNIPEVAIL
jgi:hypothetical protein